MSDNRDESKADKALRDWSDIGLDEQTELLIEHGRHLDHLPLTCSVEKKIERLRSWLLARGIRYNG